MNTNQSPPNDNFQIRCPRLGHQISFSYCRTENQGLPCFKTLDCWFQLFEVETFLKAELPPEIFGKIFTREVKPKILSLVDLIEKAKKANSANE